MIRKFYHLREQPFGVTPDPRFLYLSATHREALASLQYGIQEGRGFLGLVAPPGMGKTTLLFHVLQSLGSAARTVFLFQTQCTPREFLRSLLLDLAVEPNEDIVRMQSQLNEVLLQEAGAGKRFVVLVDEAQNLGADVFETLRMLSNFETPGEKLMQIVLSGQPQLAEKLALSSLTQLRQRISIFARIEPLSLADTEAYISHRLRVAGGEPRLFSRDALVLIHRSSGGVPRNINNICFNALSLGCANKQEVIPASVIQEVVRDLTFAFREPPSALRSTTRVQRFPTSFVSLPQSVSHHFSSMPVRIGGLATAALLIAGGLLMYRSKLVTAADQMHSTSASIESHTAPATPSSDNLTATPLAGIAAQQIPPPAAQETADAPTAVAPDSYRTVEVSQTQTLAKISRIELGHFNGKMLNEILALNPWIKNPDLIHPGEVLRLPSPNSTQGGQGTQERAKRSPNPVVGEESHE